MQHFEIITERTSIDVRFDPHLPGLGARATGLTGYLKGMVDDEGMVDISRPVSGEFTVLVGDFDLGNRLITYAAKKWLGRESDLAVRGHLGGFKPLRDGRFEATVVSQLKGLHYELAGEGTLRRHCSRTLVLNGLTRLHPRDVGVPVPRFGIPWVHVHWDIALAHTG